jgi:hypothetical protein
LIRAGFDPDHGWQSQMIYRLDIAETLEKFWRHHSVTDDLPHESIGSFPVTVLDESLAQAINIVITQLGVLGAQASENSHNHVSSGLSTGELWSGAISSIDRQIKIRSELVLERDVQITGLALEIERLQDRYEAAESAVDVQRQEMTKLTSSKAFRLGMFITWPARHLRSAIAALKRRA